MLDLLIEGGEVVTPAGVGNWDVAVHGERIVAVASHGSLSTEASHVIDASGKLVLPGGVEPHAHVAAPIIFQPGNLETAPPDQVSQAALFGGTTTIADFAICHPGRDIPSAIEERDSRWKNQSFADYTYHITMVGEPSIQAISQIKEAISEGFPTLKLFITNILPNVPEERKRMVGMGDLSAVMDELVAHQGLLLVHSEDDDIVQYMYKKLIHQESTEWQNMHLVHNNLSEDLSTRRVIRLAEWTGASVYFVHVSAKEAVTALGEARSGGLPIYGETLHNYLSFTAEDYKKQPDGMKYHTYPSLKSEADQSALWRGLLQGELSTVATDEYCTSYEVKTRGKTIYDVTGGHNGIETRVGITYNEGVVKRQMPLERFVEVTSTNAARLLGLYPQKGVIAPGSDADIVIIDPNLKKTLAKGDFHISDYSIWEGWDVQGWPTTTILRGKVVVDNGKLLGSKTYGRLIKRKISPEILSTPAL